MEPTPPQTEPSEDSPSGFDAADLGALGLSSVAALYALFTIGAGIAFLDRQFPGDDVHRVGFVAASAIDLRIGVALVLAAALANMGTRRTTVARAAGIVTLSTSVVSAVLALLAVRAQYHQLDLRHTMATSAFHLSQATYVTGSVGPAIVAGILVAGPVFALGRHRKGSTPPS